MTDHPPNPTPLDLQLGAAARKFAALGDAVEHHPGPKSGPAFEAKIAAWRAAYAELRRVAGEHPGDPA